MRLLLVLLLLIESLLAHNCPIACECFSNNDPEGTLTVDCSNQDLAEIPYPLPNRTSHLDVSGNLIQYVRVFDFSPADTFLTILQLQNNDLLDIQIGAFRRLPNLETLILSNNNRLGIRSSLRVGVLQNLRKLKTLSAFNLGLKTLPVGLFKSFREIIHIDLSYNELEEINSDLFIKLKRLQRIILSNNFISSLHPSSFSNLPFLLQLDLSMNQLRAIQEAAFVGLPRIRDIDLAGNPIECGCCATFIHRFFLERRLSSPVCQEPPQFRDVPLLSLNLDDICVPPSVSIFPGEAIIAISNGSLLELSCVASGVPPPVITWSSNGQTLVANGSRVIIMEGTLLVAEVQFSDSGVYHCSASSSAGLASSSLQVLVLDMPEARVISALLGDNVVLNCSSEELPAGTPVVWFFNQSSLGPISAKHVVGDNRNLLIEEVTPEDIGDYICQVGRQINFTQTLSLTGSPEIVSISEGRCDNPQVIIVETDKNFVLRCEVLGIPPPTVRWIFRGFIEVEIVPPSNMEGETVVALLRILDASNPIKPQFEGNYTCFAFNSLGNVSITVVVVEQFVLSTSTIFFGPSITRLQGETAVLECPFNGLEVTWIGRDELLPLDHITFACNNSQTLILQDALARVHTETYLCSTDIPILYLGEISVFIAQLPKILRPCLTPTLMAVIGGNITLLCMARGNPPLTLVWTRGGEVLTTGGRVSVQGKGSRLFISPVSASDAGLYTCNASNVIVNVSGIIRETFSETYDINLEVRRPTQPPYFTYRPRSITVLTGGMAMINCGGGGYPLPSITWKRIVPRSGVLFDGPVEEVALDARVSISDQFLLVTDVQLSDEGFYFCILNSSLGERISNLALLNVYVFPTVTMSSPILKVELDATAVLECDGDGDPLPDIQWLLLPAMILLPTPDQPNHVRRGSDLVISNVSVADEGTYRCWVANTAGRVFQDVQVVVITPPNTIVEPSSLAANVGCQVMFRCLDGGLPPGDFQWLFNGVPVQTSSGLQVRSTGELMLSDLQLQDAGNYACTVRGALQDTTRTAVLTVQDPLFPELGSPFRPFIHSPTPSRQTLMRGQTAQFICQVEGVPSPNIVWLKDGNVLVEDARVQIFRSRVLVIANVSVADDGTYGCFAFNSEGNTLKNFELEIAVPPEIIDGPQAQVIEVHSILNLSCVVSGKPRPRVLWLINDSVVEEDERRQVNLQTNSLVVLNTLVVEDTGFYSCHAWNAVGTDQETVAIEVVGIRDPLMLQVGPSSVILEEGSLLLLDCLVRGFPTPTVTWSRNGLPLPSCSPRITGQVCVEGNSYIYVEASQVGDSGIYTCRAADVSDSMTYTVDITVVPRRTVPRFVRPPVPLFLSNGSAGTLDCVASGQPTPNISWQRDRITLDVSSSGVQLHENGSLTITEASEETVGLFTCVADNGFGLSEFTVLVDVVFDYAESQNTGTAGSSTSPTMTSSPPGTVSFFPGQSVVLDCTASGSPPPSITWTKDDNPVSLTSLPSFHQASNGSLILSEVTGAEAGNYSCTAVNQAGSYSVHFLLRILLQHSERVGVVPMSRISVGSGSSVALECGLVQSPEKTVFLWRHNGNVLCDGSKEVRIDNNGSLLLSPVMEEHAGVYKCQALHNRGMLERTLTLDIFPRPEPPFFVLEPEDRHMVRRGFLLLPCKGTSLGKEDTHLEWLHKENTLAEKGGRHLILANGSLLLANLRSSQAGNYSCCISNKFGHSISTAQVSVSRFKVNKFVYAREGSTIGLPCELRGSGVTWVKNGRHPVTSHNGTVWLSQVNQSHAGEYTCSLLRDSFNYFLTVQVPPRILTTSMTMYVFEGSVASLHCVAAGRPKPSLSWHHGELQLERGQRHSVLANGTLLVYMAERKDEGVYLCRATNTQGSVEARQLLLVTG